MIILAAIIVVAVIVKITSRHTGVTILAQPCQIINNNSTVMNTRVPANELDILSAEDSCHQPVIPYHRQLFNIRCYGHSPKKL